MPLVHLEEAEAVHSLADGADSLHLHAAHLLSAAERLCHEARAFLLAYARDEAPDPSGLLLALGAAREHLDLLQAEGRALDETLLHLRVGLVPHPDSDPALQAAALEQLRARVATG